MLQNLTNKDPFGDCKPWETGRLQDNTNLLNSFKENLRCYEKVFKKYSAKTKSGLPQIQLKPSELKIQKQVKTKHKTFQKSKTRTLDSSKKAPKAPKMTLYLHISKSQLKMTKIPDIHRRGMTAFDTIDKQNKPQKYPLVSDRKLFKQCSRQNLQSKVCLMNFDQQHRFKRVRKRQLHQIIFGQRRKNQKYQQINELR